MARYTGTVTTSRAPEEVFDYLANFSSVAEWDPGVKEACPINAGGARRGARFKVVARFLGRDVPLVYHTAELDRPRRVVLLADDETLVSRDTISFQPMTQGGTLVTYDADLRLKGARRLAEIPMRLLFRRVGDRARAGLEEALAMSGRRIAVVGAGVSGLVAARELHQAGHSGQRLRGGELCGRPHQHGRGRRRDRRLGRRHRLHRPQRPQLPQLRAPARRARRRRPSRRR